MTPATTATTPAPVPAAVLTGPPGVGKTTVARLLAGPLGAALLDLDTATAPLVEVVAGLLRSADLDGQALVDATRSARYETLTALAEDSLACATPVVLVAPFSAERTDAERWAALAGRLRAAGGEPTLVWVHASREVLRERLVARSAARDAPKLADLDAHLARVDLRPPVVAHLAVDTGLPLDVDRVVAALRR